MRHEKELFNCDLPNCDCGGKLRMEIDHPIIDENEHLLGFFVNITCALCGLEAYGTVTPIPEED